MATPIIAQAEFPTALVLCAKSNNKHGQDSIGDMAGRLAKEIVAYCKAEVPLALLPGAPVRVSFVCHSLGGLIVRRALEDPALAPLLPKVRRPLSRALYTLLSTPTSSPYLPSCPRSESRRRLVANRPPPSPCFLLLFAPSDPLL